MPRGKKQYNPQMNDDIEEIRKSLNFMSGELTRVMEQLKTLSELVSEVKQLKSMIKERDKTINDLERRIDDLEQYSRMEDVIISGLEVKPRSYAKAATEGRHVGEDAGIEDRQSLEMQVVKFLESKNIHMHPHSISACHTLPRKDCKSKPAVIVRFVNRKHKTELLMQGKKLKGSDVYLNEHLTKKNAEIAREARNLRKNNKIQATWTRNCKVLIWLNGATPEAAKVIMVRELKELDKYR